jgi:iron complex transport system substrate-binding protein
MALPSQASPQRIVTTNVCADQLALALVDRSRIASVSRLASQPEISNYATEAAGLPVNSARAEEIVMLDADLVLGDIYTGKAANALARTIGVKVHVIDMGSSLADVRRIIADTALVLGEAQRGAELIAAMDARISAAAAMKGPAVTALVYEPNGMTSGSGSLTDDIMTAAGLTNLAPRLTTAAYGTIPLEQVVTASPRLLILDDSYNASSSRAQAILRHRAFLSLRGRTELYRIPSRLWLCPGPWVGEAVTLLAEARVRAGAKLATGSKQE